MDKESCCHVSIESVEPEDVISGLENLPDGVFIVIGAKDSERSVYIKYNSPNHLYFDIVDKLSRTSEDLLKKYGSELVVKKVQNIICKASYITEYTDKKVYSVNNSGAFLTMNKSAECVIPTTKLIPGDWFELMNGEIGIKLNQSYYYSFSKGYVTHFQLQLDDSYREVKAKVLNVDITARIHDKEEE